jgi:aspartate oxidase
MNPDSIDIYTEQGIDLREPLEVAVCFQHNNGGLRVDSLYQTTIKNLFAIGEVAGAHGVSRPGGSALNSGQVGGIRVAQCIGSLSQAGQAVCECSTELADAGIHVLKESRRMLESGTNHVALRSALQRRMTDAAGFIREASAVRAALDEAEAESGIAPGASDRKELVRAWETRNLLLTHRAFLRAIDAYIADGGGSRGAYLVVRRPSSVVSSGRRTTHDAQQSKERLEDRDRRVLIVGPELEIASERVTPLPEDDSWFETTWAEWRKGGILEAEG